jgi:hypothetical protein
VAGRISRVLTGSSRTIAGTVYGTIVAMAALAAGASGFEHALWRLTAVVAVGSVVFWIAHVYAHSLGETITLGRRLNVAELTSVAQREASIVFAAILPAAALALGALGLIGDRAAVWLALGAGTATLGIQGFRYARIEKLGPMASVIAVAINVALGGVIIALKVLVAHH